MEETRKRQMTRRHIVLLRKTGFRIKMHVSFLVLEEGQD